MKTTEFSFFVGIHQPADARHFERSFISVNRLKTRKSDFKVRDWIMDSGAFTQISKHGEYQMTVGQYADQISRWSRCGKLVAACTQDFMCESHVLDRVTEVKEAELQAYWEDEANGSDDPIFQREPELWEVEEAEDRRVLVADHQEQTIERFLKLKKAVAERGCETYVMPVLQGYDPEEYVAHIIQYEEAGCLPHGSIVGVGSICKRNINADSIEAVLTAILTRRPDLKLHGFGLKVTALKSPAVRGCLLTADSMAWSFAARFEGRNQNDWREAKAFEKKIIELN